MQTTLLVKVWGVRGNKEETSRREINIFMSVSKGGNKKSRGVKLGGKREINREGGK